MKKKIKVVDKDVYLPVNSMKLIKLVRSNEVLYNSNHSAYNDKNYKDLIWERIHASLFPNYESMDENTKTIICSSVRRRWKTLRSSIARVKRNATVENYCRKTESPIIAELEFLIPHIKSTHCVKLVDELGLNDSYTCVNVTEDNEDNGFFDLTEDQDIKPNIKIDISYDKENSLNFCVETLPLDALIPIVQMDKTETSTKKAISTKEYNLQCNTNLPSVNMFKTFASDQNILNSWNGEYCSGAQHKEFEFMNSTVLCSSPVNEDIVIDMDKTATQAKKRAQIENEESYELQAKILQLLTNLERSESNEQRSDQDNHDEDRMFLLSLVSDLKRVPASKKMLVKAEIVTAIARTIQ